MIQFVAVGACYLDTILDVPRFVQEDEKLRATRLTRRRGGNCANTIEVLQQLVGLAAQGSCVGATAELGTTHVEEIHRRPRRKDGGEQVPKAQIRSSLVSVLPHRASLAVQLIAESLGCAPPPDIEAGHATSSGSGSGDVRAVSASSSSGDDDHGINRSQHVSLEHCIYRQDHQEPASSYIIRSQENGSRTIVNYNELPDMTVAEFRSVADAIAGQGHEMWFHFEGRSPAITLDCMRYIRAAYPAARVSVEVEKPGRPGLQELVPEADVVFFSRGWAQDRGYEDCEACVRDQAQHALNATMLCCTWGQTGAAGIEPKTKTYAQRGAWVSDEPCTVDTIGAGDTFMAGMLYACLAHGEDWPLGKKLEFANELAGRKVVQEGFAGLAEPMSGWL
ncbi:Ribokinase-like protein [Microdochium trichocladiopsis]|uniref:Ribokinase-like protein n=1 Tax=Microdochium trichocladiopsis TaxID=1682393 RepID=A0A9P8YF02_9PEZI|nr:Ribokinase-like protein [Microdochium trichocladiopsis]KAH7040562.1 Ribokinase-like protein [Microdochium trichocladiopsis]